MTVSLSTEAPDGSDRRWLAQYGAVNGVHYEKAIPGGDTSLTCNLVAGTNFHATAVAPGRIIRGWSGGCLMWSGVLDEPTPQADGMQLQAVGLSALAGQYSAVTSGNAMSLDTNVDACIARGLPWIRLNGYPSLFAYLDPGTQLKEALAKAVELTGTYWYVNPDGRFFWFSLPTSPSYALTALSTGGGRTRNEVATDIAARYLNNSGVLTVTGFTGNTALRNQIGRAEVTLNLTGNGNYAAGSPPTAVTSAITTAAAKQGKRANWSGSWPAPRGTIRAMSGGSLDPCAVIPGQMVQVTLADVGMWGESTAQQILFVIGQTAYDMDTETVTLTPLESAKSDLVSMLAN